MGSCSSTQDHVVRPYDEMNKKLWAEKARSLEGSEEAHASVKSQKTAVLAEKRYEELKKEFCVRQLAKDPNWVEERVVFSEYDPASLGYDAELPPLVRQESEEAEEEEEEEEEVEGEEE